MEWNGRERTNNFTLFTDIIYICVSIQKLYNISTVTLTIYCDYFQRKKEHITSQDTL